MKTRNYKEACKRAHELRAKEKMTGYAIAKTLQKEGYITSKGNRNWYTSTVENAVKQHIKSMANNEPPTPPPAKAPLPTQTDTGPAPKANSLEAPASDTEQGHKLKGGVEIAKAFDHLSLDNATRRPLKRMLSQTEWDSMPEGMREALLDRLMARLG